MDSASQTHAQILREPAMPALQCRTTAIDPSPLALLGGKGEGKGGGKLLLLLMERKVPRNVPFSRVQRQKFAGIPVMECDIGFAADYEISNWSTLSRRHDELGYVYHQKDRLSKVNGYDLYTPYTQH